MKYISIADLDRPRAGLWGAAARRAGLSLTLAPAPYVLPLSGVGAHSIVQRPGVFYMTPEAMRIVSDREALAALGVPVMPTHTPRSAEALLALAAEPVFLKPRDTSHRKSQDPLAYTQWDSPQHLLANLPATFWAGQQDDATAFSVQPLVPYPLVEVTAYVSVNESSNAFIYHASRDSSEVIDRRSLIEQPVTVPARVSDAVQTVCSDLQIKGGLHEVQFIEHAGELFMNDWNARPGGISEGLVPARGVMESALLHMVGEPVVEVAPFYGEQRGYWGRGIPVEVANTARRMGMFPRCNDGFLSRVYCEGPDVESVRERLNNFESSL